MTTTTQDRSLGELFSELSEQTSVLVKKEIELARHEMTRSVTVLARDSVRIVAGGLVAYLGAIVLLIGVAVLLINFGVPAWLAYLLVGGLTLAAGGLLAWQAFQSVRKVNVVPARTVETIKQDVEWAKDQTQ